MILGLIPGESAGRLLVDLMRRLDAEHDDDTQDWLAGNWPALFANKPISVAETLRDQPGWERFNDPWKFYLPETITARQRRWAEEDRQQLERSDYADDAFIWHEPHVRQEPKVGRNDPCPCGSGKKYKKCCLDKGR